MAKPRRTQRAQPRPAGRAASAAGTTAKQPRVAASAKAVADTATPTHKAQRTQQTQQAPTTRARAGAGTQQRRRYQQRPWWQSRWPIIGTVVSLALVVVLFIFISRGQTATAGSSAQSVPASVFSGITQVNAQVYSKVGAGGLSNPVKPVIDPSTLTGPHGHPELLYIGAEYCPYCAAQRWSMIIALSRFGTFSNLHEITSAGGSEVYPNTPTFTFYQSHYTSQYVDFVPVEIETNIPDGNGGYTALQPLTSQQNGILTKLDAAPYVSAESAGGIPFMDIGGKYITISSGYSPQVLTDLSWNDIASGLKDSSNAATQAIVGNANYLTAAICLTTNNKPANVCTAAPIPSLETQIQKANP